MPDWREKKYSPFKVLVETYVRALNERAFQNLEYVLTEDIVLSRGLIRTGKEEVLSFLKSILSQQDTNSIKFELLDASMGFFNENEAQILLYLQIYQGGEKREIHIESLFMNMHGNSWFISRIFGISYSPEEHNKFFKPFLDESG